MAPAAGPAEELALDDRPLAIAVSVDGRHLIVTLPWELWIVDARLLSTQRTIALNAARPSVVEGWEGALWIGGQHLYKGNLSSTAVTKVGSKLGGVVDHVCLVRDDLLCGVGAQGEILWDIDRQSPTHRRKSTGPAATAVVASADGRAVFADGSSHCWIIDPAHPAGYGKLQLAATSPVPVPGEAIVCLGRTDGTRGGRVILAARDGHADAVALLLKYHASPTRKNQMGDSAPMLAALRGHRAVIQQFVASGMPLESEGWTPLMYAAFEGHTDIARDLIAGGAQLDARAPNKATPLMLASRNGHIEVVRALLAAGADKTLRNDRGQSAADWARENGNTDIARLLGG